MKEKPKQIRVIFDTNEDLLNHEDLKMFTEFSSLDIVAVGKSPEFSSQFNLIFLESIEKTLDFLENLEALKFQIIGYFLIFSPKSSRTDREIIFNLAWRKYIVNINIIYHSNNNELFMETVIPYNQSSACQNVSSTIVKVKFDGENSIFFPKKLKNFNKCPVKVATFYYPPITMREDFTNNSYRYYGSEMELAFGLAEALNFTIEMNYTNKSGSSGLLLDNGTATGFLRQTIDGEVDMLMGFYYLTLLRTQYMSFTDSHYSIPLVIMIPFGKPYSSFEKLFLPLQTSIWILLLITFGGGILFIMLINCQNEKVKNFVFGENCESPYLNLINVFVGNSLRVLPRRNFARSLLMMFMLFCLVMRTVYQGSLFIILQSDGRHPEVQSIDEMMEQNFVFYIRETIEHNIKLMSFYNRRKTVKFDDYPKLRQKTLDPSFKGGVIQPLLETIYLNQLNYKNFTYNTLKEYLFDVQIVNYFPKNSYLVEPLNEKIGILKSAGLVNLWMEKYIDRSYVKMNNEKSGAKVMNIVQLSGGFQMLICGYLAGILVFIVEFLWNFIGKRIRLQRENLIIPFLE